MLPFIVCPRWEDCLHKILVWNFPHEHAQTYSHKIVHIAKGANKVWHTNRTKVNLWWNMDFRFEWFPKALWHWIYSTESAFLWAIDWCRLRYDIMNHNEIIHIILIVFSMWMYYNNTHTFATCTIFFASTLARVSGRREGNTSNAASSTHPVAYRVKKCIAFFVRHFHFRMPHEEKAWF